METDFSRNLTAEKKRLGLTIAELAEALDVSERTAWHWLNGRDPILVAQEGALARLRNFQSNA